MSAILTMTMLATRESDSAIRNPHFRVSHASDLQHARHRDRNAALSEEARVAGSVTHHFDDSAWLMHDEAQCHRGNVPDLLARDFQIASVRSHRTGRRLPR